MEVVSEEKFRKMTKNVNKEFPEFSNEKLDSPIPKGEHLLMEDERYNNVFCFLNTNETLERYKHQFFEVFDSFQSDRNLTTVIINDKYLRGTKEQIQLAKSVIVIDTKGNSKFIFIILLFYYFLLFFIISLFFYFLFFLFSNLFFYFFFSLNFLGIEHFSNEGKKEMDMQHFINETRTMSYIIKISSQVLYLIPAQNVRFVKNQITTFEFAMRGNEFIDYFIKKYKLENQIKTPSTSNASNNESSLDVSSLFGGIYGALLKEGFYFIYFFKYFFIFLFFFIFFYFFLFFISQK